METSGCYGAIKARIGTRCCSKRSSWDTRIPTADPCGVSVEVELAKKFHVIIVDSSWRSLMECHGEYLRTMVEIIVMKGAKCS